MCILIEANMYHSCFQPSRSGEAESNSVRRERAEQHRLSGPDFVTWPWKVQTGSCSGSGKPEGNLNLWVFLFNMWIKCLKALSAHSCAQINTRPRGGGGRRRSCLWLARPRRQRTGGTRKWGGSLRTENASISSRDSWYEDTLPPVWATSPPAEWQQQMLIRCFNNSSCRCLQSLDQSVKWKFCNFRHCVSLKSYKFTIKKHCIT